MWRFLMTALALAPGLNFFLPMMTLTLLKDQPLDTHTCLSPFTMKRNLY